MHVGFSVIWEATRVDDDGTWNIPEGVRIVAFGFGLNLLPKLAVR